MFVSGFNIVMNNIDTYFYGVCESARVGFRAGQHKQPRTTVYELFRVQYLIPVLNQYPRYTIPCVRSLHRHYTECYLHLYNMTVYIPNTTIHAHHTRQRDNPHTHQIHTLIARNSIVHRTPQIWLDIIKEIIEMNTRNSFNEC